VNRSKRLRNRRHLKVAIHLRLLAKSRAVREPPLQSLGSPPRRAPGGQGDAPKKHRPGITGPEARADSPVQEAGCLIPAPSTGHMCLMVFGRIPLATRGWDQRYSRKCRTSLVLRQSPAEGGIYPRAINFLSYFISDPIFQTGIFWGIPTWNSSHFTYKTPPSIFSGKVSSPRGAGPPITLPSTVYTLPWQGHSK
jgi:hypothetical protein